MSSLPSERSAHQSKDDALSERGFQLLLEGASRLDPGFARQARFVILVAGRLGLRGGEIAHMTEEWVDWRKNMIRIPRQQDCDKGRDGGICGYCKQQAAQRVDHADEELSTDEAESWQWMSKTDAAARSVPFDFDPRSELAIERFFDAHDRWPYSRAVINRRVNDALEEAEELSVEDTNPHGLRATAATYHAGRGLDVIPLQSLMGWSELSTAQSYVKKSGENTARALHQVHSR